MTKWAGNKYRRREVKRDDRDALYFPRGYQPAVHEPEPPRVEEARATEIIARVRQKRRDRGSLSC